MSISQLTPVTVPSWPVLWPRDISQHRFKGTWTALLELVLCLAPSSQELRPANSNCNSRDYWVLFRFSPPVPPSRSRHSFCLRCLTLPARLENLPLFHEEHAQMSPSLCSLTECSGSAACCRQPYLACRQPYSLKRRDPHEKKKKSRDRKLCVLCT